MSTITNPLAPESGTPPVPVIHPTEVVQRTRVQRMLHTYQDILLRLLRSPAVWVFSAAWLLSVLALALIGYLEFLPGAFGCLSIALVVGLVTVALTARAPAQSPAVEQTGAPASGRKWIWAQVVCPCSSSSSQATGA